MIRKPIIQIEGVTASYGKKVALSDVSLTVYDHDFLGIIGPNGGGKTTLVKVMLGLMRPDAGRVTYCRQGSPVKEIAMGYLPQYSNIDRKFPISVYDVVLSGLSRQKPFLRGYTDAQHACVRETLRRLEIDDLSPRSIGALSGGQLQRVLLARAIVSKPEVVVLDEPNTYIDQRFQEQMYKMLGMINADCAVVIVSHDIGSVMQNVRDVACVNKTLHYHSASEVTASELERYFGCPLELVAHGNLPHRVLKRHDDGACPLCAPEGRHTHGGRNG